MQNDTRNAQQRLRHFIFILAGQVISLFGSALTSFSLGVWAFEHAGSVTAYTSIFFSTAMGTVIAAPFAGSLVDRWNKKAVLMGGTCASAAISASIALLYFLELLEVWHIVILAGLNGVAMAFSKPAITASIKILIDPDDLGRANGMTASGYGLITLLAPAAAGFLLIRFELIGILLIDLTTFLFGLIVLFFLKLPQRELAPEENIFKSIRFAWVYLKERNALLWLIGFYFILNLLCAGIIVLLQPLVLTFSDAQGLGNIMTLAGIGYLAGAVLIGVWGGPQRKIFAVLGSALLMGIGMALLPLSTSIYFTALGAFLLAMGLPISMACNQTIIQKKVDSQFIGRVDGLGMLLIKLALPLGYLAAGPLAQYVFEPLMLEANPNNQWLVNFYGAGVGRGIALMVSLIALTLVMVVLLATLMPKIRRIELDLDDRN